MTNQNVPVTREEFNRILKVYEDYEEFLKKRNLTNGEVEVNHGLIIDSYEEHTRNHSFIEDMRGYRE